MRMRELANNALESVGLPFRCAVAQFATHINRWRKRIGARSGIIE